MTCDLSASGPANQGVTCDFLVLGPAKQGVTSVTFGFRAGKTRRDFRDFSVSGPAKQGVTSVTFGSRRLNPGEVTPQSRGGQASIPGRSRLNPKSHGSHGPFSRPETQKSRKSRRVFPARNPKVTEVTACFPGPKIKSHKIHDAFSRPETQKSQVTALPPGPETQKSRLHSRPRRPKKSQVTARFPGPETQKSQATARFPGPPPKKSRLNPPTQPPQKSQVTLRFPNPAPKSHKSRPSRPAPKPKVTPQSPAPKPTSHGPISRPRNPKVTPQSPGPAPFSRLEPNRCHKSRPVFVAPAPQKSRSVFPGPSLPEVTSHSPFSRLQAPKVTPPPSLQPPGPTPKVTALPCPLPRSAETQKFAGEARSTLGYGKRASSTPDSYDLLWRSACSEEDAEENLGREKGLGFPVGEAEAHNTLGYRERVGWGTAQGTPECYNPGAAAATRSVSEACGAAAIGWTGRSESPGARRDWHRRRTRCHTRKSLGDPAKWSRCCSTRGSTRRRWRARRRRTSNSSPRSKWRRRKRWRALLRRRRWQPQSRDGSGRGGGRRFDRSGRGRPGGGRRCGRSDRRTGGCEGSSGRHRHCLGHGGRDDRGLAHAGLGRGDGTDSDASRPSLGPPTSITSSRSSCGSPPSGPRSIS